MGLASSWEVVSSQPPKRLFRAQNLWEELSRKRNSLDLPRILSWAWLSRAPGEPGPLDVD